MGNNVKIGKGVKFVNPEYISLGDNVVIMDDGSNSQVTDVEVKLAGVTSMFLGRQMEI